MTDLSTTIEAKSDQLGADDLLGGPRTVTITKVSANMSSSDQPIVVNYTGDNGKPFLPCKTVRRLLVAVWGPNGNDYVGKSLTLYRDPEVRWGGLLVGGVRVSHVSHIEKPMTLALTATRGNKRPITVKPLQAERAPEIDPIDAYAKEVGRMLKEDRETLRKWWHEDSKEHRLSLDIPQSRLEKMGQAVAKALTVNEPAETRD